MLAGERSPGVLRVRSSPNTLPRAQSLRPPETTVGVAPSVTRPSSKRVWRSANTVPVGAPARNTHVRGEQAGELNRSASGGTWRRRRRHSWYYRRDDLRPNDVFSLKVRPVRRMYRTGDRVGGCRWQHRIPGRIDTRVRCAAIASNWGIDTCCVAPGVESAAVLLVRTATALMGVRSAKREGYAESHGERVSSGRFGAAGRRVAGVMIPSAVLCWRAADHSNGRLTEQSGPGVSHRRGALLRRTAQS